MRVHSNTTVMPTRRLSKQYDNGGTFGGTAKAVGVNAPTLITQAMGLAGNNGVVSFILSDGGAANVISLYLWDAAFAKVNSGNGWLLLGASSGTSSQACDAGTICSFLCPEGALFFLKATTAVTDCIVSGSEATGTNNNTDLTSGVTH